MRSRLLAAVALGSSVALAPTLLLARPVHAAGIATIRLTADRTSTLADGKSLVTITADVRDDRGAVVPDGTRVRFTTTAGRLDVNDAETRSGVARVTLVAADLPGSALITATLDGGATNVGIAPPSQITILFSADAEAAYSGNNWIRLDGSYVAFAADRRTLQANGKDGGARLNYRDIRLAADALQVDAAQNVVHASGNVALERNGVRRTFSNLRFDLNGLTGLGERVLDGIPKIFDIAGPKLDETASQESVTPDTFALIDLSDVSLMVVARSIALEPSQRLQFRRATIYLDGTKTVSLPFHVMPLEGGTLFTDQVVGYGPSGVTVDFPLYYDVRPSAVGTLHVRHGAQVGSSVYSAKPGWSLDLRQDYNGGIDRDGALELTGVTRQDWGARWNHAERIGSNTRGNFYVDFPNHSDLYGSALLTQAFHGFSMNLNLSGSRYRGGSVVVQEPSPVPGAPPVTTIQSSAGGDLRGQLYAETNARPIPVSSLHNLKYTVSLSTARQGYFGPNAPEAFNSHTAGVRMFGAPVKWGGGATLTQSYTVGQTWASGGSLASRSGISLQGTLAVAKPVGRLGFSNLTYDYIQNPRYASSRLSTPNHRLGTVLSLGQYERNHWNLTFIASQGIDRNVGTVNGLLDFRLSGDWGTRFTYTGARFPSYRYQDADFALIRKIAGRDLSFHYSTALRRFMVDIAGSR